MIKDRHITVELTEHGKGVWRKYSVHYMMATEKHRTVTGGFTV